MNEDIRLSRRRITRRRALAGSATVGLGALLAACGVGDNGTSGSAAAPPSRATSAASDLVALLDQGGTCGLTSEETEGPYYFDVDSIRSDIREDRPGTTLTLGLRVRDAECNPVPDSVVEIWHCDAGGEYSGFESASPSGGRAGGRAGGGVRSDDGTYLRGAQVADAKGIVQFTTVYPGWYRGRTVHIHLKVHVDTQTVLTSQLFFDDDLNDAVFATSPYDEHTGRDTRNDDDSIYDDSGRLTTQENGDGYLAVINLGIDT